MLKYPCNEHSPQRPRKAALSIQKQRDNLAKTLDKLGISTQYEDPVVLLKKWVDFEYTAEDDTRFAWSWPGGGSYRIADIMKELGVNGNIEEAALSLVEAVGETDTAALYLEEKEDGWYLVSEVAFDDTYELRVTADEKTYLLVITDVVYSSDLADFLVNDGVTLLGAEYDEATGKYKPKEGQPYTLSFHFQEVPDSNQFTILNDGTRIAALQYQIPTELTAFVTSGSIPGTGFTLDYNVDADGLVTFTWNVTDETAFRRTVEAQDVDILFYLTATFHADAHQITFQNEETIEVEIDNTHDVTVQKNGFFNPADHKMHYTVTVTSNGVNSNVVVQDVIPDTARLIYSGDAATTTQGVTITNNANGLKRQSPKCMTRIPLSLPIRQM